MPLAILGGVDPARLEIIGRYQDAWNRGDIDAIVEMSPPGAEWVTAEENPEARTLQGGEEIGAYLADWRATVPGLRFEATEYVEAGDAVVTIGIATGTVGHGDTQIHVPLCLVIRFRDARPVRIEEYLDTERALAAAGLGS